MPQLGVVAADGREEPAEVEREGEPAALAGVVVILFATGTPLHVQPFIGTILAIIIEDYAPALPPALLSRLDHAIRLAIVGEEAEGPADDTGGEFDEYVLLLNPGAEAASVDVLVMRPDGVTVSRKVDMGPHSRYTIHVDGIEGLEDTEVSTKVNSSAPIVVELAQYFDFRGMTDGNNAIGSTRPSTDWYFAEGCVR